MAEMTRRRFLGVGAAAVGAGLTAPLAAPRRVYVNKSNSTEIRGLLVTSAGNYPKYWKETTAAFKKETGITVNYDLLEFTPMTSKEVTLGAAKSKEYDVFSTHTAQIEAFFGYFEPLSKHLGSSYTKQFFPESIKYLSNPQTGELAAIPRNVDARVQYYRTDLYSAAGLKPAVTWDDLISNTEKLTTGKEFGLVVPGQGDPSQRTFADYLWQAGGEWLDEHNKPAFNSSAGIKALQFYHDLIQKYKVVPPDAVNYQWDENSSEFSTGAVATTFDWPGSFASLSDPSLSKVVGKWSTAPYVKNDKAISCAVSHAMAVNSLSSKKSAAIEFCKFVTNPQQQLTQYNTFKNFPSRPSVAKQVQAKASGAELLWLQQLNATIANGKEWPKVAGFQRVCNLSYTYISRALTNQMSPKDALNECAQQSLKALKQAGAVKS